MGNDPRAGVRDESRPATLRSAKGWASLVLVTLGVLFGSGCKARRSLAITSNPSGARVLLDDQVIGETPLRVEFHYYGVRRLCLSKEGHRTVTQLIEVEAPWYGRFPMDIVTEVLLPIGWKDRRHIKVDLPKGQETFSIPGIQSVVERARVLRRAGPTGPGELPPIVPRSLPQVPIDPLEATGDPVVPADGDAPPENRQR